MKVHGVACATAGAVLVTAGLLKILDRDSSGTLGVWADVGAWLELALGVMFFIAGWRKLAARALLALASAYTMVVVYLALSHVPLSTCGCFGAQLRLGLGLHLLVLGGLGLPACLCIWRESDLTRYEGHEAAS